MTTAIVRVRCCRKLRADTLSRYPIRSAVSQIRARVLSFTVEWFDSASETVIFATPSPRATSAMVGRAPSPSLSLLTRGSAWKLIMNDRCAEPLHTPNVRSVAFTSGFAAQSRECGFVGPNCAFAVRSSAIGFYDRTRRNAVAVSVPIEWPLSGARRLPSRRQISGAIVGVADCQSA